jgi:hypothetical protein
VRQALFWTAVWVSVAMSFNAVIYGLYEYHWFGFDPWMGATSGSEAVIQFITGYLLEWSLSVDNIFVIALIFAYLKIPPLYQYRVLFWGIVGAIVLRGMMIGQAPHCSPIRLDVLCVRRGPAVRRCAARRRRGATSVRPGTARPALRPGD